MPLIGVLRDGAGLELGHSLLSPLLRTGKVKFITRCSSPLGERAREASRKGRERCSSVLQRQDPPAEESWVKVQITLFLLSFLTPSRARQEGSGSRVAEDYEFACRKAKRARALSVETHLMWSLISLIMAVC